MENKNQPAFPNLDPYIDISDHGLTKREYFAGLAMQGLLAEGYLRHQDDDCSLIARCAVNFADELLNQLNQDKP